MLEKQKSSGTAPKRFRFSRGFTLVELIVTIALIGAFTGAVSVSVGTFDRNARLNVTAAQALADLRYAQETAMTQRTEVDFIVTPSTRYSAAYTGGGSIPSSLDPAQPLTVTLNAGSSRGVVITSTGLGGSRLSFNSDGLPLLNGSPLVRTVSVMNLNGSQNITLFTSGYSVINPVSGACGGCGC